MNLCLEIENKMIVRINQAGYGNTCLSSTQEENKGKQSALHIVSSRLAGINRPRLKDKQTCKNKLGTGNEMAHLAKVLAGKPEFTPQTHNVDERTNSSRMSSDLLTCAVVHTYICHSTPSLFLN